MSRRLLISTCRLAAVLLLLAGVCAAEEFPGTEVVKPQAARYTLPAAYMSPDCGCATTDCSGCSLLGCGGCEGAQYAQCRPTPGLPRLGPHRGACEVGWQFGRLWFETELLAWSAKGVHFPALLTTGASTTPVADAGALDQPDTQILFGDQQLHGGMRPGGRFTLGFWSSPEQNVGVEATLLGIDGRDVERYVTSDDYEVLARPFTDAVASEEEALTIAYPLLFSGGTHIDADMEFIGGEVLLRQAILWRTQGRIDVLAGYRHAHLRDRLTITDHSTSLGAASGYPTGTLIDREDLFSARNDFHGGEIGLMTRLWRGCWSCRLTTKAAFGGAFTRSTIAGQTTTTFDPDDIPVYQHDDGGLLGLPSNSGYRTFSTDAFLGEIGLTLERQISCHSRVAIGCTFLYWDSVVRLAPLIDTDVNPTQLPPGSLSGVAVPAFTLHRSDFWAQGINASFEHQF